MTKINFKFEPIYDAEGILYEEKEAWNIFGDFISKSKVEQILASDDVDFKEIVFKSIYSLYKRTQTGETKNKDIPERIDKAINRAYNKSIKNKKERINFLARIDEIFCLDSVDKYGTYNEVVYNIFEKLLKGNIVILDQETYLALPQKHKKTEYRVIGNMRRTEINPQNYKNVNVYPNPLSALKNDTEKEIFVIGGLELFETYYTRVTDLFFIKEETLYNGYEYFPEINISDFEPRESTHEKNLENPDIDLTLTHWRKIKNRKLRLRPNKYSNGLKLSSYYRKFI